MIPKIINKTILLITVICFTSSCGKKDLITRGVEGEFAIINLAYENRSLLRNLSLNIIEFHTNGNVIIPKIVDRHHNGLIEDDNINGTWKLVKNEKKFQIEIKTNNKYFNNKFDLSFSKTENGNILINLNSNNLSLTGEKSFFDYRQNKTLVDNLIDYTK